VKKSEQIRALQAECDRLTKERDTYRAAYAEVAAANRRILAKRDQSLVDQARSEFRAKWEWLLEAVGL
jgi:uncharacterized coiled-coil DUF342 family protein